MESKPLDLEILESKPLDLEILESKPLDLEVTLWNPNLKVWIPINVPRRYGIGFAAPSSKNYLEKLYLIHHSPFTIHH